MIEPKKVGWVLVGLGLFFVALLTGGFVGIWWAQSEASKVSTIQIPTQTSTQTQDQSVPGMQKYTDTDFGFSFWYPNNWLLSVSDSRLSIEIKDQDETYPKTITISKVYREDGILDASGACGACSLIKYYFDKGTHTWMQIEDPLGNNPTTSEANTSANTMGGLHIFRGGWRYDGSVVPLSAHNFVTISGDDGGLTYGLGVALTKTIVATDPSVATPVSEAQQRATIQAEKDYYSAQ